MASERPAAAARAGGLLNAVRRGPADRGARRVPLRPGRVGGGGWWWRFGGRQWWCVPRAHAAGKAGRPLGKPAAGSQGARGGGGGPWLTRGGMIGGVSFFLEQELCECESISGRAASLRRLSFFYGCILRLSGLVGLGGLKAPRLQTITPNLASSKQRPTAKRRDIAFDTAALIMSRPQHEIDGFAVSFWEKQAVGLNKRKDALISQCWSLAAAFISARYPGLHVALGRGFGLRPALPAHRVWSGPRAAK